MGKFPEFHSNSRIFFHINFVKTMAEKPTLSEISTEDLQKRVKVFRSILAIMGVIALGYVGFYLYLMISGRFDSSSHPFGIVPLLGMLVAGLPSLQMLQKHKAEITRRQNPA